jgi:hypothetical protein
MADERVLPDVTYPGASADTDILQLVIESEKGQGGQGVNRTWLGSTSDVPVLTSDANGLRLLNPDTGGLSIWPSPSGPALYNPTTQNLLLLAGAGGVLASKDDGTTAPSAVIVSGSAAGGILSGTFPNPGLAAGLSPTFTNLTVTGNETVGGTLGVTGATTVGGTLGVTGLATLGALTATGNVALGDANADIHTMIGVLTVRNAAGTAVPLFVDVGNGRTIVGGATPLGADLTPCLQVIGRLYVAPETDNDTALQIRRGAGAAVGVTLGLNATADLVVKDVTDTEVVRVGAGASAYQLYVTGAAAITSTLNVTGLTTLSAKLTVSTGGAAITGGLATDTLSIPSRIVTNGTGVGLFGATPIARPTVVGTRTGTLAQLQTVVANLLSALDGSHLGAISDLTS